jgi:hypothetical protein
MPYRTRCFWERRVGGPGQFFPSNLPKLVSVLLTACAASKPQRHPGDFLGALACTQRFKVHAEKPTQQIRADQTDSLPARLHRDQAPGHEGQPERDRISTSYVERQNLTMRMGMRRFTRPTNGFSRKVENLAHAVSLPFMHYNLTRPHKTLKERYPRTPAMAAGVADHIWSLEEIAALLD